MLAESLHAWASLVVLDSSVWVLFAARAVVTLPTALAAAPTPVIEPGLLNLVLRHDELSLGAKTLVIYILTQPHAQVIPRAELERLDGDAATSHHLDRLLHELVAAHWLMPVPGEERPCCADGFLLRQDTEA